jgi:hypothetical protein
LGAAHAPFRPDGEVRENLTVAGEMLARLDDRRSLLASFDRHRESVEADRAISAGATDETTSLALDILTSSRLARALDLDQEDPRTRDRYGVDDPQALPYSHLGYKALMSRFLIARWLIEAGVRCVTVSFADFDWHGSNFSGVSIVGGAGGVLAQIKVAQRHLDDNDDRNCLCPVLVDLRSQS